MAYGATSSGKTHTVTNLAERVALELNREAEGLEKQGRQLEVLARAPEAFAAPEKQALR